MSDTGHNLMFTLMHVTHLCCLRTKLLCVYLQQWVTVKQWLVKQQNICLYFVLCLVGQAAEYLFVFCTMPGWSSSRIPVCILYYAWLVKQQNTCLYFVLCLVGQAAKHLCILYLPKVPRVMFCVPSRIPSCIILCTMHKDTAMKFLVLPHSY